MSTTLSALIKHLSKSVKPLSIHNFDQSSHNFLYYDLLPSVVKICSQLDKKLLGHYKVDSFNKFRSNSSTDPSSVIWTSIYEDNSNNFPFEISLFRLFQNTRMPMHKEFSII